MPHHEPPTSQPQVTDAPAADRPRPAGPELSRRTVVAGTGVLAVTAALAACSGEHSAPPAATGEGYAPAPPAASDAPPQAPEAAGGLARTTDIPVGGGEVFPAEEVVVTQPEPAQWRAFSAICTHQGCTVGSVQDGTINCPCHGSKFAVTDGSVVDGPATRPLPPREVEVQDGWVRVV
ncbi:MAG TPA: Rieske (2Fe-2S) protein [Pseudonocardiaceae bacterium]|nr:Rieske (2Fe-2S) protein [Pseudonocardiaceae bacterium]